MGSFQRTLAMAFILALGAAFMPLGCGGSGGGFSPGAPVQRDAQVPPGVAQELRTCTIEHKTHLGRSRHSVRFDVQLANNGQVDSVALRASTLADEDLEACMAHALRSLSEGRHSPCAGVHTHGRLRYQEIRNGICTEVDKEAVRCEGPFKVAGPCGSVSTVGCGDGGPEISGIFVQK
jgi:hypothetical protein